MEFNSIHLTLVNYTQKKQKGVQGKLSDLRTPLVRAEQCVVNCHSLKTHGAFPCIRSMH